MRKLASLLVSGALVALACGEDPLATDCESDADCPNACAPTCGADGSCVPIECPADEACDEQTGRCVGTGCENDDDCTDPCAPTCGDDGTCEAIDCPDDEICDVDTGTCVSSCTGDDDCYGQVAFCGDEGGCVAVVCGAPANDCDLCSEGPMYDASGPVIFGAEALDLDEEAADGCLTVPDMPSDVPCAGGKKCRFQLSWFDEAPGTVPGSGFNARVQIVTLTGMTSFAADAPILDEDEQTIAFDVCYQTDTVPRGAVFVEDTEGNSSNTLCFGTFEM